MFNIIYVSIIFGPVWSYIATSCHFLCFHRGTGMIANSSRPTSPPPHLGRVIKDLFRLLHALVHSDYPRDATASKCLAIIFGRIASVYPGSSAKQRCQGSSRINAGTGVGRGKALNYRLSAIEYLTSGMSRGMNRVILSYCYYQIRGYRSCVLYS